MASKNTKHWLGRPPKGSKNVERWTGRRWVKDDGKLGLAFSGQDSGGTPYAWGPGCYCGFSDSCPHNRAGKYTCSRFSASNGRRMVRVRTTKTAA